MPELYKLSVRLKADRKLIFNEVIILDLYSDNAFMVLRLLAESGRISRAGLIDIMPFSYRNKCVVIKRLTDKRYIRQTGKLKDASYTLMANGRDALSSVNAQRYTPELFELNDLLKQHAARSMLRGDITAAMSLAGYATHPADKPTLPAATPNPFAYTADALKTLYRNFKLQEYGTIIPDATKHFAHATPLGCYYDCSQIKYTRSVATENGVNYSRSTGVLLTPSHLFRVYHGNLSDIQYHKTGEDNFYSLILGTFTGYLPPEKKAVLLFGREYAPAESLLDIYMNGKWDVNNKQPLLGPSNLGSPLHYLPLSSTALELLGIMRYPDWYKSIAIFASEIQFGIQQQQAWSYDFDGWRVYILADLNLTHFAHALKGLDKNPGRPTIFVCLPWQADFIESQSKLYSDNSPAIQIQCLPDNFIKMSTEQLENYWGGT